VFGMSFITAPFISLLLVGNDRALDERGAGGWTPRTRHRLVVGLRPTHH
jgi:hypothetical protein